MSAPVREALATGGEAILHIDLRQDVTLADLQQRVAAPRGKQSLATFLRKAGHLSPVRDRSAARGGNGHAGSAGRPVAGNLAG
jgi:predicted flavoprotein YhiN